uniref:hypothetical protein n=1 Tax=Flavobacterium sp. TaxID=239 RepID=UPI004049D874
MSIKDKFSFDVKPIKNQEDWSKLVRDFCLASERFIQLVEKMTNEELMSDFVSEKYGSYYRNIDVMIEHTNYHLGQILLIKKMIQNRK